MMSLLPAAMVDAYLGLCEERRLDEATSLLTNDVLLVFPGGVVYTELNEMADASAMQYRRIRKPERHYAVAPEGDSTIVTCRGTLAGEWLDGRPFGGIRFLDLFVVRGGQICEQHVFNDIAAIQAQRPAPRVGKGRNDDPEVPVRSPLKTQHES